MLRCFLDTSALVKLYDAEQGSETVERLVEDPASEIYISWLAIIEFSSALAAKVRMGHLAAEMPDEVLRVFRADVEAGLCRVYRGRMGAQSKAAADLVQRFGASEGLRTLDSLQLAVGIELLEAGWVDQLVSADRRFCSVAAALALPILDPTLPESA